MSRYGLPLPDGTVEIVSFDDGKDAPWCDSAECYMDRFGEHHAEGCLMYGTFHQAAHRLDHAAEPVVAAIRAELSKTRRGRLAIRYVEARAWLSERRRRLSWRLWKLRHRR